MTTYWCERAWLGAAGFVDGVVVEVEGSRISSVSRASPPPSAERLPGLTVPGFANCHSHAFHRALRGRTQRQRGDFWTWRETMYAVADRLDPDTYYALALATYREMALTGITAVGEFHYLHHGARGAPYGDLNAMGHTVEQAARDAGLRIALLDTCYLSAGFGAEPSGVQRRFSDGTVDAWCERVTAMAREVTDPAVVVGAAIHSVRAVPHTDLGAVASTLPDAPLHVHLSEQVAENTACLARHGCTPTQLLAVQGVLSERLSAVHATHLTAGDIALLGNSRCNACFCPTTERDLADGIGPSRLLADAGATLTLGSDSHAVIDMHEEMRAVELDERLHTQQRGHWTAGELLTAATVDGHRSLGFFDAGQIEAGAWADLVTIAATSPRTAGSGADAETAVFAATSADVTSVIASGRHIELDTEGVGRALADSISAVVA
ncbi:MAG: formimidoylglutamate deiminase [Propionibacteriales bacterium]|nr:formimidoylglutamate deiminase [Propionibacteriales bacterium]